MSVNNVFSGHTVKEALKPLNKEVTGWDVTILDSIFNDPLLSIFFDCFILSKTTYLRNIPYFNAIFSVCSTKKQIEDLFLYVLLLTN